MVKDKNVVIIGGNGLLGKEIAEGLNQEGANVIIADFKTVNDNDHFIDINSEESVDKFLAEFDSTSKIDAVVNLAYPRNKTYGKKVEEVTLSSFNENVNLHLGGYFNVTKKFCLYFKNNGGGKIINFSSIYGVIAPKFEIYEGTPMTTPIEYAAVKSSLVHLTKYFAKYFSGNNISVNAISPGGIFDSQNPLFLDKYNKNCNSKGMLDKKDITGTVSFLISDQSNFITGQNIVIDDGFTL